MEKLTAAYHKIVGREAEASHSNTMILDAFAEKLTPDLDERIAAMVRAKPFVATIIAHRAPEQNLFRQPSVLLLYYLADSRPNETKAHWPLTPSELRPIYDDLGQNFDA